MLHTGRLWPCSQIAHFGCEALPGTNALAYLVSLSEKKKSFVASNFFEFFDNVISHFPKCNLSWETSKDGIIQILIKLSHDKFVADRQEGATTFTTMTKSVMTHSIKILHL